MLVPALRNQIQESTISAQLVPGHRFLVFDFGVLQPPDAECLMAFSLLAAACLFNGGGRQGWGDAVLQAAPALAQPRQLHYRSSLLSRPRPCPSQPAPELGSIRSQVLRSRCECRRQFPSGVSEKPLAKARA
eukprot:3236720-Rhodomonas_salina.1